MPPELKVTLASNDWMNIQIVSISIKIFHKTFDIRSQLGLFTACLFSAREKKCEQEEAVDIKRGCRQLW